MRRTSYVVWKFFRVAGWSPRYRQGRHAVRSEHQRWHRAIVEGITIPVIAFPGGVSCIDDIKNLMKIGILWGVITGKAIYSGAMDLKEAIQIAGG